MKNAIKAFLRVLVPVKLRPRLGAIYKRIFYFGFRYKCPFCNSHLRTFRPFGLKIPVLSEKKVVGGGYRTNAICPVCGSIERERVLYLFLLHKTDIFENPQKVLHIAPEARVTDVLRKQADELHAHFLESKEQANSIHNEYLNYIREISHLRQEINKNKQKFRAAQDA